MQQTLIIVKPEAVEKGLTGEFLKRFEEKGLRITKLKMMRISEDVARDHYKHHADKDFFPKLLKAITAGCVVVAVLEGEHAIEHVRNLIGETDPLKASPGSIRGDFAVKMPYNMIHASDKPDTAADEIERFFE